MQGDKKYLLSTRPLRRSIVEEAATKGVIIEELSFINTAPVRDDVLYQKIKALSSEAHTVVFTSMNAVEAVAAQVSEVPAWKIYSMGNTTRKLIEEAWGAGKIVATAENAQRLGERLIDDGVEKILFFCGNIRRDELPNKIRSEGGEVEEIIVYETAEQPTRLLKEYDGILFFSPSAVNSFFKNNKAAQRTHLFAIGKTTADTLRPFANRKIIVANASDKEELTRQAIDYLSNASD